VLSWLVAFGIINTHNRLVAVVGDFLYRITEPLLRPIRNALPAMGGLDLSPMVLIFIIMFLQSFIRHLVV
jgi:YggT family protein